MQVCPKCGAEIKYIATGYSALSICEKELISIVTDRGMKIKGYPIHICKEKKDERATEQQKQYCQ